MYLLLTWSIDPGPTDPLTIEAEMHGRIAGVQPQCSVIAGHTLLMQSRGGDAEYERLLDELLTISAAFDDQLNFALVKSKERLFAGTGFDTELAKQIIR